MPPTDAARLRALQDRWLALPSVQYQIRTYGEDEPLAASFAGCPPWPTFRQVREQLHPDLEVWFRDFFRDELEDKNNGT